MDFLLHTMKRRMINHVNAIEFTGPEWGEAGMG
jgi:hypothetical protein